MADISAELRSKTKIHASMHQTNGSAGPKQHSQLSGRDAPDQHPISSITGLAEALSEKSSGYVASKEPPTDTKALWVDTSEPDEAVALGVTATETDEGVDIFCTDELGTVKVHLRHGKDGAAGAQGPQGPVGPAGPQGAPGDGYELTDEDVQEIAEIAAGMVPGGGEVWETIIDYTVPEDCMAVILTTDVGGKEFKLKAASAVFVLHPIEGAEELASNVQMGYSFLREDAYPYNSAIYRWGYADVPRAAGQVSVAAFLLVDTGNGVKIADYRQSGAIAYAANGNAKLKIITNAIESTNMDTLRYKLDAITACSVGSFVKSIGAGTRIKMMGVRA